MNWKTNTASTLIANYKTSLQILVIKIIKHSNGVGAGWIITLTQWLTCEVQFNRGGHRHRHVIVWGLKKYDYFTLFIIHKYKGHWLLHSLVCLLTTRIISWECYGKVEASQASHSQTTNETQKSEREKKTKRIENDAEKVVSVLLILRGVDSVLD